MKSRLVDLVSNVAHSVADRLPDLLPDGPERLQWNVPKQLDLHYITERVLVTSQPTAAAAPTFRDRGRGPLHQIQEDSTEGHDQQQPPGLIQESGALSTPSSGKPPLQQQGNNSSSSSGDEGSAQQLGAFIEKQHAGHALGIHLSDRDPDDQTLRLLRRQLLRFHWASPCKDRSETPTLPQLLEICYAMQAHLSLDEKNVVVVYCANGKTRSAIVVACYLRIAGLVRTSLDGFAQFLSKRCPQLDAGAAARHIPPSLQSVFRNFDELMELGGCANPKPLLLRAIAIQGVPVEDKPCIDIWDSDQKHLYSSLTNDLDSHWSDDDDGFYKVNKILEGDFCLLCRFGGDMAMDMTDPSKVLFRYANHTGFLSSGPYEFAKNKVDMMRRWEVQFDEEDFLLTLILESYWDAPTRDAPDRLRRDSAKLPRVLSGQDAQEEGWHVLTKHHAARPTVPDVVDLRGKFSEELSGCPDHICTLALQMANFDTAVAKHTLCEGSMRSWWKDGTTNDGFDVEDEVESMTFMDQDWSETTNEGSLVGRSGPVGSEPTCVDILDILDGSDSSENDSLDPMVFPQHFYLDDTRAFPNNTALDGTSSSGGGDDNNNEGVVDPTATATPTNTDGAAAARGTGAPTNDSIRHSSVLLPHRGDVVDAFGAYSRGLHGRSDDRDEFLDQFPPVDPYRPQLPMHKRKRERADDKHHVSKLASGKKRRGFVDNDGFDRIDSFEEEKDEAMKVLVQINHTGVTLDDLLNLKEASRQWNTTMDDKADDDKDRDGRLKGRIDFRKVKTVIPSARTFSPGGPGDGVSDDDDEEHDGDLEYEDADADGPTKDDAVLGLAVKAKEEDKPDDEEKKAEDGGEEKKDDGTDQDDLPLKKDPRFAKYFKMLQMRLPLEVVKHAMKRDQLDPSIMDLDHNKSLKSQQEPPKAADPDDIPIKDDPEFEKVRLWDCETKWQGRLFFNGTLNKMDVHSFMALTIPIVFIRLAVLLLS